MFNVLLSYTGLCQVEGVNIPIHPTQKVLPQYSHQGRKCFSPRNVVLLLEYYTTEDVQKLGQGKCSRLLLKPLGLTSTTAIVFSNIHFL